MGKRTANRSVRRNSSVKQNPCYHCKEPIAPGDGHDCSATTEEKLTEGLSEDLKDAWERLREFAASLGKQRIYASHRSIMFSRKTCHFFVRPRVKSLELCFFLERKVSNPLVKKSQPVSKTKICHTVQLTHRDQVEAPITDWLGEAFRLSG